MQTLPFLTAQCFQEAHGVLPLEDWALGFQVYQVGGRIMSAEPGFSDAMWQHVPTFPYSSFGYSIPHDGPLYDVISGFKLTRLANIAQLGFLTPPTDHERENLAFQRRFGHSRYNHSLDVAALTALMLHNVDLPEQDKRDGVAGALLHDLLMPAGGDTTKLLDKKAFDEDANFTELMKQPEIQTLCRTHGLLPQSLDDVVQEKTLAGQVKNIADKLAYVCRDAQTFLNSMVVVSRSESCRFRDLVRTVVTCQPFVGDLWEDVRLIDGNIVFTNPARLSAFLMLRAIMFRDLYLNPYSRGYEFLIYLLAMKPLYEQGILNQENLLSMSDPQLHATIRSHLGISQEDIMGRFLKLSRHAQPATKEDASTLVEQMKQQTPFVLSENFHGAIKPCTEWLTMWKNKVVPLHEALPQQASTIQEICELAGRIMVHWIQDPPQDLVKAYESLTKIKPT
jgi:HD superfamily phosphohydrolase